MGFSKLGRGMWDGLWPLSVCQALVSWRTHEQGLERMGSLLGRQPSALSLMSASGGGEPPPKLRLPLCFSTVPLSKQLCLCGGHVLHMCVERYAEKEGR